MTPLPLGDAWLTIEGVVEVACGRRAVGLSRDPAFRERIARGALFLKQTLDQGGTVYGVNTGYGDSCVVEIPPHLVTELPVHLVRYHGCGSGELLDEAQTLAVLVARLCSLARGFSGVRWELLQRLEELINRRILPCIPAEGSVGASGDLTPLSYVAATLIGEREVSYRGNVRPAAEVLREAGLVPLELAPKEGLAVMNGTAVMRSPGAAPSTSAASPRASPRQRRSRCATTARTSTRACSRSSPTPARTKRRPGSTPTWRSPAKPRAQAQGCRTAIPSAARRT
jgi:histidine ammonia-lyase